MSAFEFSAGLGDVTFPVRPVAAPQTRSVVRRRPNLFVIGAMKSGTTFLSRLLDAHPSIYIARPEEPSYFVAQEQLRTLWPGMWDRGYWRSKDAYLRLFEPGGDAAFLGEASTNYTKIPLATGVPERIARFAHDPRFIYVMRDPVERSISHYWHMVRFSGEHRPMLAAMQADPRFCAVSHYAMQLGPYFALFGRERVFTLTYEAMARQPEATIRRLYAWLGVDPSVALPPGFDAPENATPEIVLRPGLGGVLHRLRWLSPLRRVIPHVPQALRTATKRLASETVRRRAVDTAEAIAFLRPLQQRQTEELAALLGRDFPEWTTLHGSSTA